MLKVLTLPDILAMADKARMSAKEHVAKGSTHLNNPNLENQKSLNEEEREEIKKKIAHLKQGMGDGYELQLLLEKDFDESTAPKRPVLVRKNDGHYGLWGRKEGKWQYTPIDRKKLNKDYWVFPGAVYIWHNDMALLKILEQGHVHEQVGLIQEFERRVWERMEAGQTYFLACYEANIETAKRLTFGNCQQYAYIAFDYLLKCFPHVKAAVFELRGENADHAFVVLNYSSEANDLKQLGEEAVICDPLADIVCLASEYKEKLEALQKTKYVPFVITKRQWIGPHFLYDPQTEESLAVNTVTISRLKLEDEKREIKIPKQLEIMLEVYHQEMKKLITILEQYRNDLLKEQNRLTKKYSEKHLEKKYPEINTRINIITDKQKEMDAAIHDTNAIIQSMNAKHFLEAQEGQRFDVPDRDFFIKVKANLRQSLTTTHNSAIQTIQFSQSEKLQLYTLANNKKKKIMTLFDMKSNTQANITEMTTSSLNKLLEKKSSSL